MIDITHGYHAKDEFGHDYVAEWIVKQDGQEVTRLYVDAFVRHPAEDTSRTYTRQERAELGLGWRYERFTAADGRFIELSGVTNSIQWVGAGRSFPTMAEAVTAALDL